MNNPEDELFDSPITVYDVFLSHASEDKPYVREVASGLKKRGITFCMDEIDFIAGMSLRQQIDASISASFTTVLFLSSQFFLKGWTRQEFDGAFALENHGLPKLLPVWLNVDKEAVTRYSPMLAARLAIRANDNADETADKIASQFEKLLCFSQSWGHIVRIDTKCLPWFAPPSFNHKSLKVLDDFFPYFWSHPRQSESLPGFSDAVVSNIGEALLDPTGLDGKCVFIVGQQNLVQVYNRHQNDRLEWVFQLTTNVPEYKNSVIYVRCAGHAGSDDDWPKAPMGYSTVVMGYVIAHGPMTLSNYTITSALYVVAFNVMHLPSISNQAVQRKSTILGNLCSKLFKR